MRLGVGVRGWWSLCFRRARWSEGSSSRASQLQRVAKSGDECDVRGGWCGVGVGVVVGLADASVGCVSVAIGVVAVGSAVGVAVVVVRCVAAAVAVVAACGVVEVVGVMLMRLLLLQWWMMLRSMLMKF